MHESDGQPRLPHPSALPEGAVPEMSMSTDEILRGLGAHPAQQTPERLLTSPGFALHPATAQLFPQAEAGVTTDREGNTTLHWGDEPDVIVPKEI